MGREIEMGVPASWVSILVTGLNVMRGLYLLPMAVLCGVRQVQEVVSAFESVRRLLDVECWQI